MLVAKNLGLQFSVKALNIVTYLTNLSPTKAILNITLEEAWSRHKPMVSHLCTFSYIAYMLIPKEQRKRLDAKSRKCIFIGHQPSCKAYKLFGPITKQMYTSQDVIFSEGNQDLDITQISFFDDQSAEVPTPQHVPVDQQPPSISYALVTSPTPLASTLTSSSTSPLKDVQ